MPSLTSEIVCCVLGLALGIGTWIWATHRQFPPHLMTPASSRELQTALDNFYIVMRYITGTTIPYTIHALAYTALVLILAYPFMDDFFTLPEWIKTYLTWPILILAIIGMGISTIDIFCGWWIANRLDRELAE